VYQLKLGIINAVIEYGARYVEYEVIVPTVSKVLNKIHCLGCTLIISKEEVGKLKDRTRG
jgi:hypothetical protein